MHVAVCASGRTVSERPPRACAVYTCASSRDISRAAGWRAGPRARARRAPGDGRPLALRYRQLGGSRRLLTQLVLDFDPGDVDNSQLYLQCRDRETSPQQRVSRKFGAAGAGSCSARAHHNPGYPPQGAPRVGALGPPASSLPAHVHRTLMTHEGATEHVRTAGRSSTGHVRTFRVVTQLAACLR